MNCTRFLLLGFQFQISGQWSPGSLQQTTYRDGNVGIGVSSPQGRLQISRTVEEAGPTIFNPGDDPNLPLPSSVTPHIRFNTFFEKDGQSTGSSVWDIDAQGSLNFNHVFNASTNPTLAMSISQSGGLSVYGSRLTVGTGDSRLNTGAGTSLFGAEAYHLGFGVHDYAGTGNGTFFNFGGGSTGGAVIQADVDGNLIFMTKENDGDFSINSSQNADYASLVINNKGKVSIGTIETPDFAESNLEYKLYVNGGILSTEMKVRNDWADYVFENNYQLLSLKEVEEHINEYGYLHNTPSAKEIQENGLNVGEMTSNQQEKIEELFLHLIEMEKRIDQLEKENQTLKNILIKEK